MATNNIEDYRSAIPLQNPSNSDLFFIDIFGVDAFVIGGQVESWLPIDCKLPVVFGLVVNFGDWKKLR